MVISVSEKEERIVEKGENASDQHYLFFPKCFQKFFFSGSLKVWIVWKRVKEEFKVSNLIIAY